MCPDAPAGPSLWRAEMIITADRFANSVPLPALRACSPAGGRRNGPRSGEAGAGRRGVGEQAGEEIFGVGGRAQQQPHGVPAMLHHE